MEMQNPQPVSRQDRGLLLIVDDDAINCAILENIFAPYYKTAVAENGRAGLERVMELEDELCAVLLDVMMPEMDGIQVLRCPQGPGRAGKNPGVPDHRRDQQ